MLTNTRVVTVHMPYTTGARAATVAWRTGVARSRGVPIQARTNTAGGLGLQQKELKF